MASNPISLLSPPLLKNLDTHFNWIISIRPIKFSFSFDWHTRDSKYLVKATQHNSSSPLSFFVFVCFFFNLRTRVFAACGRLLLLLFFFFLLYFAKWFAPNRLLANPPEKQLRMSNSKPKTHQKPTLWPMV